MNPIYRYLNDADGKGADAHTVQGPYRVLELEGRRGIHPTSIHTRIEFPRHTLNAPQGSATYWVFALEEVFTFHKRDVMYTGVNKAPHLLTLLTDHPDIGNFEEACFVWTYEATWHPAFLAKFYKGDVFLDAIRAPQKAYAMASGFEIERHRWYQFTLTWDFEREEIFIYANGVRVACADRYHTAFKRDSTGPKLYSARPIYCFGELAFYDHALSAEAVAALYQQQAGSIDPAFQRQLRRMYAGEDVKPFDFVLDADWITRVRLDLRQPQQLDAFRVQGITEHIGITEEGLHIRTPQLPYEPDNRGNQMYLWLRDRFEGDVYIDCAFRPNQAFGLGVLVFQASGMSREDIEQDYAPRTTGNMQWIHSSDMRCYHLEYYRHMTAVRNDIDNVALIKNPYQWPLAFACLREVLHPGQWHRLQVVQQRGQIHIAINGMLICTGEERPFSNNGPVLTAGRIALRCMIQTDMHFRDLHIATRKLPYAEVSG